jgi:hypothetical protein
MTLEEEASCRCRASLESELGLINRLLTLAKSCSSPALKALIPEWKAQKRKLIFEVEARPETEGEYSGFCAKARGRD